MKGKSLRLLMIEDSEDDALLTIRVLKKGGYNPVYERVETATAMKKALKEKQWEIILCDYQMPTFDGPSAIALKKEANIDIPLIILTGKIGEETAADCMRLGAQDYIMKNNLSRLCPAIARELEDAKVRNKQRQAEENLKESEKRYRLLADNIHDVVFVMDMNLNYTYISPSVKILRGYEPEEALKHTPAETMTPSSVDLVLSTLFEIMEIEKSEHRDINISRTLQLEMSRKDGTTFWVETKASFIRDEKQRAVGIMGVTRDITERKQIEDTLYQNEEKYRTILEDIQDGYFEADLAGNFTFFNNTLCRVIGYSRNELMGMNYRQHTDKEDLEKVYQAYNKVYTTRKTNQELVWQIIRKDGIKRYVEASISLRKDSSGKPIGFRGIARDVTEHKKVEAALKKSEEQYRLLADNMTAHIWLMDLNTRKTIYVSPSVEKMYGYTSDEIINLSLKKFLTEESVQKMRDAYATERSKALANPLPYVNTYLLELQACHKDGHLLWIENTLSILRDKNGKPEFILGETRDITERKQAEEELRKSEENFRLSLDSSPLGVRISTIEAKTIYANKAILDIYGYDSIEELNKTPVKKRYTPQSYAGYEIRKEKRKRGEFVPSEYEISIVRKNGEIRNIQVYRKEIIWNGTKQFQVIYKDITEQKRAEEKLNETLESLRKSIKTTIQVLGIASEARDPYTAGHQKRVADLACAIATEMGLPNDKIEGLQMEGSIHDIGKLSIPAEILSKPAKLTDIEFSLIKEHPRIGCEMLKDVESPWPLAQIVYQHHERMNGTGYPRNLKGDEILLEARILAVADVAEAMASHRPYRPTLGIESALEEITKNKGILYDADVADACLKLFREKGYQLK